MSYALSFASVTGDSPPPRSRSILSAAADLFFLSPSSDHRARVPLLPQADCHAGTPLARGAARHPRAAHEPVPAGARVVVRLHLPADVRVRRGEHRDLPDADAGVGVRARARRRVHIHDPDRHHPGRHEPADRLERHR